MSNRFLVTQSLLSSWLWLYKASDPKKAQMDFLRVLERRKERPTGPMLDGIQVGRGSRGGQRDRAGWAIPGRGLSAEADRGY